MVMLTTPSPGTTLACSTTDADFAADATNNIGVCQDANVGGPCQSSADCAAGLLCATAEWFDASFPDGVGSQPENVWAAEVCMTTTTTTTTKTAFPREWVQHAGYNCYPAYTTTE